MNRKIGIVTFHRADNLGAVLQAYALQRILADKFGFDAQIVDYRCPKIDDDSHKSSGIKALALQCYYKIKHLGFEKFRSIYLKTSAPYSSETIIQCASSYDAYITGSDQVWNYECSDWDDTYFLSFAAPEKKKYAYAASIGRYRFTTEEQEHIREMLSSFSGITVREVSAKEELQKLGVENVTICPDPVVLLDREQWMQIMPRRRYRGKYVFVYMIMDSSELLEQAKAYARKKGYRVICNKTSPEFILHGSPSDFLSWIFYSECVFTNSFHGTTFSLLLGKPLAAETRYPDGKINERVYEMLDRSNALSCALDGNGGIYTPNADQYLEAMQQEAFQYLKIIDKDLN